MSKSEATKRLAELIDSAKREAISEYIEPHLRACRDYNGREWCKNCGLRPLQEQSGEQSNQEG